MLCICEGGGCVSVCRRKKSVHVCRGEGKGGGVRVCVYVCVCVCVCVRGGGLCDVSRMRIEIQKCSTGRPCENTHILTLPPMNPKKALYLPYA